MGTGDFLMKLTVVHRLLLECLQRQMGNNELRGKGDASMFFDSAISVNRTGRDFSRAVKVNGLMI